VCPLWWVAAVEGALMKKVFCDICNIETDEQCTVTVESKYLPTQSIDVCATHSVLIADFVEDLEQKAKI
jgi:hypothetical protein